MLLLLLSKKIAIVFLPCLLNVIIFVIIYHQLRTQLNMYHKTIFTYLKMHNSGIHILTNIMEYKISKYDIPLVYRHFKLFNILICI